MGKEEDTQGRSKSRSPSPTSKTAGTRELWEAGRNTVVSLLKAWPGQDVSQHQDKEGPAVSWWT